MWMADTPHNKMNPSVIRPGLVSVSFRDQPVEVLIEEVAQAGLLGIEWGGDVHVPHGDTRIAEDVYRRCQDAGLLVAAYGSYYRLGELEGNPEMHAVLDSALALQAPTIRVWAGRRASGKADEAYRQDVIQDARRFCRLAQDHGVRICLEYHGGTLTDCIASTVSLLKDLKEPNLDTLWQPPNGQTDDHCLDSLHSVLDRLSNVHVFHWGPSGSKDRRSLKEGRERWKRFLAPVKALPGERWALLEFVKDNSLQQFREDARTLKNLIEEDTP
jgi:sugar phosphate isomerase/epimerase